MVFYLQEEGMQGSQPDGDCWVWTHGSARSQAASLPGAPDLAGEQRETQPRGDGQKERRRERDGQAGGLTLLWFVWRVAEKWSPSPGKSLDTGSSSAPPASLPRSSRCSGPERRGPAGGDGTDCRRRREEQQLLCRSNRKNVVLWLALTQGRCCWCPF